MTPEEVEKFEQAGRQMMTGLAFHLHGLREWKKTFDARGGQPVLGDTALEIVSFVANPLLTVLDGDATMQTIFAKHTTEY